MVIWNDCHQYGDRLISVKNDAINSNNNKDFTNDDNLNIQGTIIDALPPQTERVINSPFFKSQRAIPKLSNNKKREIQYNQL